MLASLSSVYTTLNPDYQFTVYSQLAIYLSPNLKLLQGTFNCCRSCRPLGTKAVWALSPPVVKILKWLECAFVLKQVREKGATYLKKKKKKKKIKVLNSCYAYWWGNTSICSYLRLKSDDGKHARAITPDYGEAFFLRLRQFNSSSALCLWKMFLILWLIQQWWVWPARHQE